MKMFREPRVEGIRYARFLLRMAEDYKAKKAAGSTWETQKLLRQIRGDKRKKTICRNMDYLVLGWMQFLTTLPEWKEEELWAVKVAKMAVIQFPDLPKCRPLFRAKWKQPGGTEAEEMRNLLCRISDRETDEFMQAFWMLLKTAKREKQQHLTEFFLEWIWVTPEKTQVLESLRYWAADYCLPFV